jgi:hypothetical protein
MSNINQRTTRSRAAEAARATRSRLNRPPLQAAPARTTGRGGGNNQRTTPRSRSRSRSRSERSTSNDSRSSSATAPINTPRRAPLPNATTQLLATPVIAPPLSHTIAPPSPSTIPPPPPPLPTLAAETPTPSTHETPQSGNRNTTQLPPNILPTNESSSHPQDMHSRPPTPNWTGLTRQNWTGFTPIPNFQQAREEERNRNEGDETEPARRHPGYFNLWGMPREIAMEPMSIGSDLYLDYRDPQNIKFFNKGSAKLPGEPFGGKHLFSWLRRFDIRATEYQWIPTLTINGKMLTSHFAEITMEQINAAVTEIQTEAQRRAQNSRMIFYCITASITPQVMDKIILKASQYTLEIRGKQVQDGILLLKVLIDSYYASTRTTTINLRRQLSNLPYYMKNIAKGDVSKLCQHTRSINAELEAAGEKTFDLVSNLLAALEEAPNEKFKRWLETKQNQFIMKEVNWKEDGSDLMNEAETFFLNLKNNRSWWPKQENDQIYALQATEILDNETDVEDDSKPETITNLLHQINAFSAKLSEKEKREQKYKWKLIPPKDGESTTKTVLVDGKRKKYYWCVNHQAWTLHSPAECKKNPINLSKKRRSSREEQHNKKPKAKHSIEDLQVAFRALANSLDDTDSNTSDTIASNSSKSFHSTSQEATGYETDET